MNRNSQQINKTVRVYQSKRSLTVIEGMRNTLPAGAYPALEIEPNDAANEWATTRAQRPRFTFTCTLTVLNENLKLSVEYISTITTVLTEIMTSPENLQLRVIGETKWDTNGGLVDTYMLDSLVDSVSYSTARSGTIRVAEFSWFVVIHEPYPESKWRIGSNTAPSLLRPQVIEP